MAGTYTEGFLDGKREGARFACDALADSSAALAQRLAGFTEQAAAINEATAILRDAARSLDYREPDPEANGRTVEKVSRPAESTAPASTPREPMSIDDPRAEEEAERAAAAATPKRRTRSSARR